MELASRQFMRAVRGKRSQKAFSRRLGYRGNPVADWESGRRFPTAVKALSACKIVGIDVYSSFASFHPPAVTSLGKNLDIACWLDELRGTTPLSQLAERARCSRFAVSRFLKGQAQPRLPIFFRLVEAITGRVSDLVAQLVPIELVPSLEPQYIKRKLSRNLAYEEPWTEAILRVMETPAYRALSFHQPGWIGKQLRIDLQTEQRCLEKLEAAGVIEMQNGCYRDIGSLTVETHIASEAIRRLKAHWTQTALQRIENPTDSDLFSYNVFSVAEDDLEKIRELMRLTFREIRSIVANTHSTEAVALINLQLLKWIREDDLDK